MNLAQTATAFEDARRKEVRRMNRPKVSDALFWLGFALIAGAAMAYAFGFLD